MNARYLAGPLAVFALSTGLMFSPSPAYAAPDDLMDMVIAGGKKAAPVAGTAVKVGSRLNPASLAVTSIAWAAWETSDIWLPWAQEKLGIEGFESNDGGANSTANPGCNASVSMPRLDGGAAKVEAAWSAACVDHPGGTTVALQVASGTCMTTSGTVVTNTATGYVWSGVARYDTTPKQMTANVCGSGQILQGAKMRVNVQEYVSSMEVFSDWITLGREYPLSVHTTTTEQQCKKPDGSIVTISRTVTGHAGIAVPSCENAWPGSIPWVTTVKAGPSTTAQRELVEITHPVDVKEKYGDCFDAFGSLQCRINVWVDGTVCRYGEGACADWWGIRQAEPERVQCKFGGYVVSLSECTNLKRAYTKVTTVTKTDPATGEPDLEQEPDVVVKDPPIPSQGPNPEGPPVVIDPENPPDPDGQGCFGEMWGWNPVDWVYVPVKCSLLWAFKPDPSLYDWSGFVDQVEARPPTSVILDLGSTIGAVADGYQGATDCGVLADFSSSDIDGSISCAAVKSVPGYSVLYALVQVGLLGVTAFGMFKLVQRSLGGA